MATTPVLPTMARALRSQLQLAYGTQRRRCRGHARRSYSAAAAAQRSTESLEPKTKQGEFLPSSQPHGKS